MLELSHRELALLHGVSFASISAAFGYSSLWRVTGVTRQPLSTAVASAFDGHHGHWLGVETMNPVGDLRREVLRLTRIQDRSVCFRIPQLAAFFHLPERRVREELASLAQNNLIHLSSWDGHQLRDLSNWSDPEAFINSTADAGHVHAGAVSTHHD